MNVKMSVFVILVEAIIYYENKKVGDCRRYGIFRQFSRWMREKIEKHGRYVGFCRRVGTLWSENCQNSVNQLNNANETCQF